MKQRLKYTDIYQDKITKTQLNGYILEKIKQKPKVLLEEKLLSQVDLAVLFEQFFFMKYKYGHAFNINTLTVHLQLLTGITEKSRAPHKVASIISKTYTEQYDQIPVRFRLQHDLLPTLKEKKDYQFDCLKHKILNYENFLELKKKTNIDLNQINTKNGCDLVVFGGKKRKADRIVQNNESEEIDLTIGSLQKIKKPKFELDTLNNKKLVSNLTQPVSSGSGSEIPVSAVSPIVSGSISDVPNWLYNWLDNLDF
jgi:hypothetical protein